MNETRTSWRRSALTAVALCAAFTLLALPATALAKTKIVTRIVASKTLTFTYDDPQLSPWVQPGGAVLPFKLQKKSGKTYKTLSGTVAIAIQKDDGTWISAGPSIKTSGSFPLLGVGRYRLKYSGNSTYKPATAYTVVTQTFGLTVSDPVVTFEPIAASTDMWVSVVYTVGWNTAAYDVAANGPLGLSYDGVFYTDPEDVDGPTFFTSVSRNVFAPGTVEFRYRCSAPELLRYLDVMTSADVGFDGPSYYEAGDVGGIITVPGPVQ